MGKAEPAAGAASTSTSNSSGLRLAGGLEHGGFERFAGALARPDDELERRVIALAGIKGVRQQHLALPPRGFDAARKHERMTKHHEPIVGPEIEVPDPHLGVDHRDQSLDFGVAALWHLELESAGDMHRLDVVHPG